MDTHEERDFNQATRMTVNDLRTIARTINVQDLSSLPLPEVERLLEEVARVVPAGNVPGFVLSGLSRMSGRAVPPDESRKHVSLLFTGLRQMFGTSLTTAFMTGTASVLYGYQQILKLAGKDPDSAFPDGTWQFYLEFALREDTARHANETTGFDAALRQSKLALKEGDALAAWLLAVAHSLRQLPAILANEWRERVTLHTLAQMVANDRRRAEEYRQLYSVWEKQRPFNMPEDAQDADFAAYRARSFEVFCKPYLAVLRGAERKQFDEQMAQLEQTDLPAYQQQMTWLAFLQPDAHSESRVHYPLEYAKIGIIWRRHYYLLPLMEIFDVEATRRVAAAILADEPTTPPAQLDDLLLSAPRGEQQNLRRVVDAGSTLELEALRRTPVIINWDQQDSRLPLAMIRRAKRGVGDHALTLMRTQDSMVFDQSHIFFDGAWGASVAEILTNEAIRWAKQLAAEAPIRSARSAPYPLLMAGNARLQRTLGKAQPTQEVTAETTAVDLDSINALRNVLKQRSEAIRVTVNDLLILYRALHALNYKLAPALADELAALKRSRSTSVQNAGQAARESLERTANKNPAILILLDASRSAPRERLFVTTFRNPLTDLWNDHHAALETMKRFRMMRDKVNQRSFEEAQAFYLRMIGGFGELMARHKDIALRGQSTSTASIKLMAHMPEAMQRLLNAIPGKFDVLNEIIKGEEVFSNVGRVAPHSTLRRFITAKDDNLNKMFCWGVLTDAQNVMHISLRDFRPHVAALLAAGHGSLAQALAQDYLDSYALGLNAYVAELREITIARTGRRG